MERIKNKGGRPKGVNQTKFTIKLDNELLEFVNSQDNKNRFINNCIRYFKENGG